MNAIPFLPEEEVENSLFECQTSPPQRILLADADADIRCLNTDVLTDSGYVVDAVEDGVLAWSRLQMKSYDLLITDINLPTMSGIDLLQKLHAARMVLPIVLISEIMLANELTRHPWPQVKARLHKPCTLAKLLETVGSVLRANPGMRAETVPMPIFQIQPSTDRPRL
jgi:DNA-binding response OmpR family regulator